MMSRRVVLPVVAAATLLVGGACYQDDSISSSQSRKPFARVFLTDAPFPYDSVASANIHIVRVEANTQPDTSGGGEWVLVTEPRKTFNLLALQQGTTALLGEGELSDRLYRAVRMVIDADGSSVVWNNGSEASVTWPWPGSGLITMYALVEEPLFLLADENSIEIVIDFDVGRSFLYDYYGTGEFTVLPWLRAVHRAFTGTIAGTVASAYTGQSQPIKHANVTVYAGDPDRSPLTWYVVATGRTDAAGRYTVAFLSSGTYIVRIEQPDYPFLDPVITRNVEVSTGATTTVSVSLPEAGAGGGVYVHISGPTSVGVGGTITLRAAVGDGNGDPVPNPSVTWTSSDPTIASVTGLGDTASVTGREQGQTTIAATSGGVRDSLTIEVVGSPAPVATVTVVPGSAQLAVADSVGFRAELRDDAGNLLTNRPVSWFTPDSAVIRLYPFGVSAVVQVRAAGTAILRATSEGKTGQATITTH
jgi:hypothetical protein